MRDIAVKLLEEVEANRLPSLPHILIKLLQACREEEVCFDTISELISQDASLCAKVIKAANSPVYGRARNLNSLKHTLLFLGLDTIKSVAITASIKQFFSEYSSQKTSFLKDFWQHSLSCANIARSLAELTNYPYAEEAYISGLLHDIGKLMLEPVMDAEYKKLNHGGATPLQILQSEEDAFGLSHSELAARILEKWHLPDVVCDAIRYHHAPLGKIQNAHHLAKIINLANTLASDNSRDLTPLKSEAARYLFDLSEGVIDKLLVEAEENSRSIALSMEIDIGDTEKNQQIDEQKQLELAREVRDNALILGSQPNSGFSVKELYLTIQQSISLLFGINTSLILTPNDDQQLQVSSACEHLESQLFSDLKIELDADCVITQCLTEHRVTDSFSAQSSDTLCIIDEQVIRGLKTDGFVCIPVIKNEQIQAVALLACDIYKATQLLEHPSFLRLFAENISDRIKRQSEYQQTTLEISNRFNKEFIDRAREIIHETNNPLSVIRNYLQILSKKLQSDTPVQNDLQIIKQEIDRIGNIILRCKEKHDTNSAELTRIDLNQVINELFNIYKSSLFLTHNIKAELELESNLPKIESDKDIIKQIITNLVKNAVEAIGSDGQISISSGSININGKSYIELKLRDNGPGIPKEILSNIFKPVISTKGKAHSGLGLSITKNLVNRTGGSISCRTNETGTTFIVQFPDGT